MYLCIRSVPTAPPGIILEKWSPVLSSNIGCEKWGHDFFG